MKRASVWARLPLEVKEPTEVVKLIVRTLRKSAPSLDSARFRLGLMATSSPSIVVGLAQALPRAALGFTSASGSRSLTAAEFLAATDSKEGIATFNGWLTESLAPADALALVERLVLTASPAAIRSTSISVDVENLRLLGAPPEVLARLSLTDLKVFKRKERFALKMGVTLPASGERDPAIQKAMSAIAHATGLAFDDPWIDVYEDSSTLKTLSTEQLVAVTFAAEEAFADTRARARPDAADWMSLAGLGTSHDAFQRRMADWGSGRSAKVSFVPIAKRVIRRALPEYRFAGQDADDVSFEYDLGDGLHAILILVRDRGFGVGKMFHLALGVRLDAFGIRRTCDIMELLGHASGWQFSYFAADELERILDGIGTRLPPVMREFEESLRRRLVPLPDRIGDDIRQRGPITARQGYGEARACAASLLQATPLLLEVVSSPDLALRARLDIPAVDDDGRLQRHAAWYYRFGSAGGAATVSVKVPSIGSAVPLLLPAMPNLPAHRPVGDAWIDSDAALRRAEAATEPMFRGKEARTWELLLKLGTKNGPRAGAVEIFGPASSALTPRWWVHYLRADKRGRCDVDVLVDAVGLPESE